MKQILNSIDSVSYTHLDVYKRQVIYYPLWLLYAAGVCKEAGNNIYFLDAPAKRMTQEQSFEWIKEKNVEFDLIVIDTSTPSIYNDTKFAGDLKDKYPNAFVLLVGTHPTALPEETLELDKRVDGVATVSYTHLQIKEKVNIKQVCNMVENYDKLIVAYEEEKENSLKSELKSIKSKDKENIKIAILVGPEGGIDLAEIEELRKAGAVIVTLGKRILRTETVALNVLSNIMYELEE